MTHLESYLAHLQRFGIQPGLERICALLQRAGEPPRRYPIVLVGGTNGKGSTCEFLAHQLAATGCRVGLYTSPHLYRWNERIRVLDSTEGQPDEQLFPGAIGDAELDALLDDALPYLEAVAAELGQPTEFETLTLLGLWHFARSGVDAAVVEVGLGGRWDATNATDPVVSVITHVALDHCDRLGDTVEEIARDKVEIARPGRVLVTAETKPEVLQIFHEFCAAHGVTLWPVIRNASPTGGGWVGAEPSSPPPTPPSGRGDTDFQRVNWLTALAAQRALDTALGRSPALTQVMAEDLSAFPMPDLAQRRVPGRAEVLRHDPVVVIDGANNPDGAAHLAEHLEREWGITSGAGRLVLVLGILADKDYAAMTAQLASLARAVVVTQSTSPRAAPTETVAAEARRYCGHVEVVTPVPAAVARALMLAGPDDVVCVTGSFYTIAEVDRGKL